MTYSLTQKHTKHSTNLSILLDLSLCSFFVLNSLSKLNEAFMNSKGNLQNMNQMYHVPKTENDSCGVEAKSTTRLRLISPSHSKLKSLEMRINRG